MVLDIDQYESMYRSIYNGPPVLPLEIHMVATLLHGGCLCMASNPDLMNHLA
jgi:hypothetical protein